MLLSKFTGKTMVFKNENGFYRTTISTKNREGEYVNKGINIATGRYIGFIDSDDYVSDDYFEVLHK